MDGESLFEWLTREICKEYKARADRLPDNDGQDTKEWRSLREELQHRCNIQEIEAFNILRGNNVDIYLNKYDILSGRIPMPEKLIPKKGKTKKNSRDEEPEEKKIQNEYEDMIEQYENRIAELESMARISAYGFEERD